MRKNRETAGRETLLLEDQRRLEREEQEEAPKGEGAEEERSLESSEEEDSGRPEREPVDIDMDAGGGDVRAGLDVARWRPPGRGFASRCSSK